MGQKVDARLHRHNLFVLKLRACRTRLICGPAHFRILVFFALLLPMTTHAVTSIKVSLFFLLLR